MNIPGLLVLLVLVASALWVSEHWGKKGFLPALLSRKLLHVAGVGSLAISPLFINNYISIIALGAGSSLLCFFLVKKQLLVVDIYNRPSWGIALFPISFLLLWVYWGREQPLLVVLPMLILTFADAGAAIVGGIWAKRRYNLTGDEKSVPGSLTFAFITLTCLWVVPPLLQSIAPGGYTEPNALFTLSGTEKFIIFLFIAIFSATAEANTSGGWDNITVPFLVAWLLAVLPLFSKMEIVAILPVMVIFALFGWLAHKKGWLDKGGAVTAGLLGMIIWIGGNWNHVLFIGLFFLSGSLLGKLKSGNLADSDEKKGKPRDYMQVLCNGGVAGVCMVWNALDANPHSIANLLFAISVAISTADTWSSEIGTRFGRRVINIIGFKSLPPGVSGGISWQGTLAGFAGAFFMGAAGLLLKFNFIGWIIWGGFAGMLMDSMLGTLLQAGYLNNGKWSDLPLENSVQLPAKGFKWMTNDLVNLYSNLIITLFLAIIFLKLWKGG